MSELDYGLAILGALALALGLFSRWLRQSFISENILALIVGILAGPLVLDILDINRWADEHVLLEQAARLTLAVALMEVALRLPKKEFLQHIRSYAVLLGGLMPIMWLVSSLLVWLILGLPVWVSLLIGAVITPTDPVVASSIVTGPVADKYLPSGIRDTLAAESGGNDGLAYPFVMLPILVLGSSFSESIPEWLLRTVLFEVGVGIGIGALIGYLAARLLIWAETKHAIQRESFLAFTLALSITTLGIASAAKTEGILAVFASGVVFHLMITGREEVEVEPVQGAVDQFFSVPIFAVIGLSIPLQGWVDLGWPALLLVVAVMLLRRIPGMLLIYRWVDPVKQLPDAFLLGWFGPIGIAALYYANFAHSHTQREDVWIVGSLIICSSIIIHGVTASPLSRLYGTRTGHVSE